MLNALLSKSKEVCRFPKPGNYTIKIAPDMVLAFEVLSLSPAEDGFEPPLKNHACAIIEQLTIALSYTRPGETVTPTFDCTKCRKSNIKIKFKNTRSE